MVATAPGRRIRLGLAALIGVPLGVGGGMSLDQRADGRFGRTVRFIAERMGGVPSIVISVVAWGLVVVPMRRFSALAGATRVRCASREASNGTSASPVRSRSNRMSC